MYNVVELFSGIGSQMKALKNIDIKINKAYTCEWDIHAMSAYDSIFNSTDIPLKYMVMDKEKLLKSLSDYVLSNDGKQAMLGRSLHMLSENALRKICCAIERSNNFIDVSSLTGDQMPKGIDILTYSFPCQDLSNVGAFHGYNKGIEKNSGSRSSLLWQVGRILQEMKDTNTRLPRFLLMENVPTLLSNRHFENFNIWIKDLEKLGYTSKYFRLNAKWFGIPQNRPRLLMLSVRTKNERAKKYLKGITEKDIINDYQNSPYYRRLNIEDLIRMDYSDEQIYNEACECCPNDTVSRRKIWEENPQLVLKNNIINKNYNEIRTITTKQDRHPNSGNLYFNSKIAGRAKFRYLTPRECFLFMGFTDEDYNRIISNNPVTVHNSLLFSRDRLIRMAGNSIPVKLLEGIFLQIKIIDEKFFNKMS